MPTPTYCFLDTETRLFGPGNMAPEMVCLQFAFDQDAPKVLHRVFDADEIEELLVRIFTSDVKIVGHNVSYDMAVLMRNYPDLVPYVFEKYEKAQVVCTKQREKLIRIATGEMSSDPAAGARKQTKFSLAACMKRRFNLDLSEFKDNPDGWRLRYAELENVPVAQWPPEAVQYAKDDITHLRDLFFHQHQHPCAPDFHAFYVRDLVHGDGIVDEANQARGDFALALLSNNGVITDPDAVFTLVNSTRDLLEKCQDVMRTVKFLKPSGTKAKPSWSKDTKMIKAAVEWALGEDVPTTPTGATSTSKEALELAYARIQDHNDDRAVGIKALLDSLEANDTNIKWNEVLLRGTRAPIHAYYNSLVETGRTSCMNPNMQNPKRKGGVRECFVPRHGYSFVFADYSTLELRALAQVCLRLFGYSKMAEALNLGMDLHLYMAGYVLGKTYDEMVAGYKAGETWAVDGRQLAKAANFGIPGGLGAKTFIEYAWAGYGVKLHEDPREAERKFREIKCAMYAAFPEMEEYHGLMGQLASNGEVPVLEHVGSGRLRGQVPYCAACNSLFQGLASDGAKRALFLVARACYDPASPLFGCKLTFFLHDELGLEAPVGREHEAGTELSRLMVEAMREFIPDIVIEAEAVAMKRWLKGAKPVFVDGRLVPGRFDKATKKWVPDLDSK